MGKVILKKKRLIDHTNDRLCVFCGRPIPKNKRIGTKYCCIGCQIAANEVRHGWLDRFSWEREYLMDSPMAIQKDNHGKILGDVREVGRY